MAAPEGDKPLTDEDLAALAEARAPLARGERIALAKAKRRLLADD